MTACVASKCREILNDRGKWQLKPTGIQDFYLDISSHQNKQLVVQTVQWITGEG